LLNGARAPFLFMAIERFNPFPTGTNGLRVIDGQELEPTNPHHAAQLEFDELVTVVLGNNNCRATLEVGGNDSEEKPPFFTTKPEFILVNNSSPKPQGKLGKKEKGVSAKQRRHDENMKNFTGIRKVNFYVRGEKR